MRSLARLLALTVLAAAAVAPATATASTPDAPRRALEEVRYNGTFVGEVVYRHHADYGSPNYRKASADIKVTSTLLSVRFLNGRLMPTVGKGTVEATGAGKSNAVHDDGQSVVACAGDEVSAPSVPSPFLVPVGEGVGFFPFAEATIKESCTATGEPDFTTRPVMPGAVLPVSISPSEIGSQRISVPVLYAAPMEKCPGYEGEATVSCTYNIDGTLTLSLVPNIDVFDAPTRPVLKRKAKAASIRTRCAVACTATLEVRPLRGSGRDSKTVTLKPGAGRILIVKPGGKLRKSINRSGGARLKVTYRSGKLTKSYLRTVRS